MTETQAVCVEDYEVLARGRLPTEAYEYCAGGAGAEITLGWNVDGFDEWMVLPRVFAGSIPELQVNLAAGSCVSPIGISPVSLQAMVHPDAECALATAAERIQCPITLSMFASESPEQIASVAPTALKLQQIYLLAEPALTNSVIQRATAAGFAGLVVTGDTPVQGVRRRDRRQALRRFEAYRPALCQDPVFSDMLQRRECDPATLIDSLFPYESATWDDLSGVIKQTRLPVYVKGIVHPDDAQHAIDVGAAGVIVSNHGGRQLDRSPSTVRVLAEIADRCDGRIDVLLDSGVRSGGDVFTALALGADAVFVGRPAVWALAVEGAHGVEHLLGLLLDELARAMSMTGARTIKGIDRTMVRQR